MATQTDTIERAIRDSCCPYARVARLCIWTGISAAEDLASHIGFVASALKNFTQESESPADTFVLPVFQSQHLTVDQWRPFLRQLLAGLWLIDQPPGSVFNPGHSDDWDFEFSGTRFFVMLLAPIYAPGRHSRNSRSDNSAYILFHPERAFRRFGIHSGMDGRSDLSATIQRLFARDGSGYAIELVTDVPKWLRYIKPQNEGDPAVDWTTIAD